MENNHKVNSKKEHPLLEVWNAYPQINDNFVNTISTPPVEQIIGEMFTMGEFYYYTINVPDSTLLSHHHNILKMHGLKTYPKYLKDIIDMIHPDDLEFVIEAERMTMIKMAEIGFDQQQNLKCSYCFRMKTAGGNYEMFHHQSLHIAKSDRGKLMQAVNIHITSITSRGRILIRF